MEVRSLIVCDSTLSNLQDERGGEAALESSGDQRSCVFAFRSWDQVFKIDFMYSLEKVFMKPFNMIQISANCDLTNDTFFK